LSETLLRPSESSAGGPARVTTSVLLTTSAISVALALQIGDGHLQPVALLALTLGIACVARACFGRPIDNLERLGPAAIDLALGVGLAITMAAHVIRFPITTFPLGWPIRVPVYVGICAAGLLALKSFQQERRWQRARLPLGIGLFVLTGIWIIVNAPEPAIDVYVVLRDSCAALLAGRNPYAITFPNIYEAATPFYGPGVAVGGRLNFGFVYPPLILLFTLPGYLLGDVRYAHLVAMAATAALIGVLRPGRRGFLVAMLYLFSPRSFFVMERSWTDPFVTLTLALVVFAVLRARRLLPLALGLLLASKQYLVLALPALPLLWPAPLPRKRFAIVIAQAALVAAVISLPLALWDVRAFWHSTVDFQANQPFREDALSYLAAFAWLTGLQASCAIGFVGAVVVMALAARRCPRTPSGFCTILALTYFVFFAFNKQAFCNYYFFPLAAVCAAIAALDLTGERDGGGGSPASDP
jgi:hypothetical protein